MSSCALWRASGSALWMRCSPSICPACGRSITGEGRLLCTLYKHKCEAHSQQGMPDHYFGSVPWLLQSLWQTQRSLLLNYMRAISVHCLANGLLWTS